MERITVDPKIHFGKPVVKGTRITVQNVLELVNEGLTFDQIIRDYYLDLKIEDMMEMQKELEAHSETELSEAFVVVEENRHRIRKVE